MNIAQQIKDYLPIDAYLASRGVLPASPNNKQLFRAPYREDKKASFFIMHDKKRFRDLTTGEEGSVIDLHMKLQNISFTQALLDLKKMILGEAQDFSVIPLPKEVSKEKENGIIIKHTQDFGKNPALVEYITQERKIALNIAKKHCQDVYFSTKSNPDKNYFGIGFINDKGGFEIRNKFGKYSTSKEITSITQKSNTTYVFEGFMDYLSYLTLLNKTDAFTENIIILNSIVNVDKAKDLLLQPEKLLCYLDNDKGGLDAFNKIKDFRQTKETKNLSQKMFPHLNDVNDFLIEIIGKKKSLSNQKSMKL